MPRGELCSGSKNLNISPTTCWEPQAWLCLGLQPTVKVLLDSGRPGLFLAGLCCKWLPGVCCPSVPGTGRVAGTLLGSLVIPVLVELWLQSRSLAEEEQLSACRVILGAFAISDAPVVQLTCRACTWRNFSLVQELSAFGLRPQEMAPASLAPGS